MPGDSLPVHAAGSLGQFDQGRAESQFLAQLIYHGKAGNQHKG